MQLLQRLGLTEVEHHRSLAAVVDLERWNADLALDADRAEDASLRDRRPVARP